MWTALRTTYHEPDLTGLISHCMRPLAADLRKRFAPDAILLWSHWKRGLHVNLVCNIDDEQRAAFEDHCVSWIADWLALHPSTVALDHNAYIASSRSLGLLENDAGPFGPLRPNNTIEVWDYTTPEISGSRALGLVWERFLANSLNVIFALAALRRTNAEDFYSILTIVFATVGAFGGERGLAHGHLSFRAHAEGLLAMRPEARPVFVRAERALAPVVTRALRDTLLPDYALPVWLADWRHALHGLNEQIGAAVAADGVFDREDSVQMIAASRFGAAMHSPAARTLFNTVEHRQYRTLLNFFYRILPTIGLSPLERARFAYVFAACCQDVLNVDWESVFYRRQG